MSKKRRKKPAAARKSAPPEAAKGKSANDEPAERKPGRGDTEQVPPTRRAFLWKAWVGLAVVATAEWVWVALDFFRPRRVRAGETDAVLTAGPVEGFSPGSVTAFPGGKFYLVRLEDGGFLAVSRECTHLNCTVPWVDAERSFVCPCHSSAFDMRGDVVNPPAPRALDLFEVRIENRIVKVNTANVVRRHAFHPDQVTHA